MPNQEQIKQLMDAFNAQGFVRIEADASSIEWAQKAKVIADKKVQAGTEKLPGWFDLQLELEIPANQQLFSLWDALLVHRPKPPLTAQLSTLVAGFDCADQHHHRHVDGYYKPHDKPKEVLAWHALLVGILIVDLPDDGESGNPVVWPGSHRLTRTAMEAIKDEPTPELVGGVIHEMSGRGTPMQHIRLHGPAGTIFVLDHDLHHGMIPHRKQFFQRHIAYYRVPDKTSDAKHVVNRGHFFRS